MPILEIHLHAFAVERLHLLLSLHELLHGQLQEITESEVEHSCENEWSAASAEWLRVGYKENTGDEQQHYGYDGCDWFVGDERKIELNIGKTQAEESKY